LGRDPRFREQTILHTSSTSMNILKILVLLAVLLIVGVLMIPLFVPTVVIETTITVNKGVDRAFEIVSDTAMMPGWLTGFKYLETVSGKPNQVGSRYRLYFEEEGNEIVMTEEVTAFRPGELMAFTMENEMMANNTTVRFAPSGGGTEITGTTVMDGKGVVWGALLPLMKSVIEERSAADYGRLKALIDAAP
jgi:uncharacterized protein YndB with AHSA1/START domain